MSSRSPAYPGYAWGILADHLLERAHIENTARCGADGLHGVAGGGGGYRFAGPRHSETLDIMRKKYSNWFSPNLHEFWGERDRLPFDHWFLAFAAPRPFIAPEGMTDTISHSEALRHSILGAVPPTTYTVSRTARGCELRKPRPHIHRRRLERYAGLLPTASVGKRSTAHSTEFPPRGNSMMLPHSR